jgi:hypothetical protein
MLTIFCASFVTLFASCKKSSDPYPGNSIIGNWEMYISYGGFGGQTVLKPGNGNVLKFQPTTYKIYSGGALIRSGQYKIIKDSFYMGAKIADRIIYDNEDNAVRTFIEVSNNHLRLFIDAYDAPSAEYIRVHL